MRINVYTNVPYHCTARHPFHVCVSVCVGVCVSLDLSQTVNLSQCSSLALRTSHPSPKVTRWTSVGACQGLCGLHKAAQRFPFPGALTVPACLAPAWPRCTVFMSCVIADLSLSRRPASVKIAVCSLQARPKSHQLPQTDRVSHNQGVPRPADWIEGKWHGISTTSHTTTFHPHQNYSCSSLLSRSTHT